VRSGQSGTAGNEWSLHCEDRAYVQQHLTEKNILFDELRAEP